MRAGFAKRMLAFTLCVTMTMGSSMLVNATEGAGSESTDNIAVVGEEPIVNEGEAQDVSGNDAAGIGKTDGKDTFSTDSAFELSEDEIWEALGLTAQEAAEIGFTLEDLEELGILVEGRVDLEAWESFNSLSNQQTAFAAAPTGNAAVEYSTATVDPATVRSSEYTYFKVNMFDYEKSTINAANAKAAGVEHLPGNFNDGNSKKSPKNKGYLWFGTEGHGNDNTYGSWNAYHTNPDAVYQGIAAAELQDGLIQFQYKEGGLFARESGDSYYYSTADGAKEAYYNVDFPYWKEGDYYVFDSDVKSATLYKEAGVVTIGDANNGFRPFGTDGDKNYYFGMNFKTEFYMTDDGQFHDEDCKFEFSGDDDVFVFIDGVLVLDMGGIHGKKSGYINFATGEVHYDSVYNPQDDPALVPDSEYNTVYGGYSYNFYTKDNGLSRDNVLNRDYHELQVYYMERGASASNCRIKFNLPLDETEVIESTEEDYVASKTAELVNWNDRTYDIRLTASSTSVKTTTTTTPGQKVHNPVDVVLVLDVSGSMDEYDGTNKTRLANLQDAANNFIDKMAEDAADNSRIAIVEFSSEYSDWSHGMSRAADASILNNFTDVESGKSELHNSIDSLYAFAGTRQNAGLAKAKELMDGNASGNEKYVILFTDGVPGDNESDTQKFKSLIADEAYETAASLKDAGVKIYTVQLGEDNYAGTLLYDHLTVTTQQEWVEDWQQERVWHQTGQYFWQGYYSWEWVDKGYYRDVEILTSDKQGSYSTWLADLSSGADYAKKAAQASGLNAIFQAIQSDISQETVTETVAIEKPVTITDVLDNRFELIAGEKTRLESLGATVTAIADGTTAITWNLEKLDPAVTVDDTTTPGWSNTIHVKAKDSYIGGNDASTNVAPASGVKIGNDGTLVPFVSQPAVNVRAAAIGEDLEETIFLGENLKDYVKPESLLQNIDYRVDADGKLIPTDARKLFQIGGSNDADVNVSMEWYTDEACTAAITEQALRELTPEKETVYYAKLTIDPKTDGASSLATSDNKSLETITLVQTYTVKVVSGSIVLEKKIKAEDVNWEQGNPIFTLSISDGNVKYSRTVEFTKDMQADSNGYLSLSVKFDTLKKGDYTASEDYTVRYQKDGDFKLSGVGTCPANVSGSVFKIGKEAGSDKTELNSRDGKATLTNKRTYDAYSSDTDTVVNKFRLVDGKIVISQAKPEEFYDGNTQN